MITILVGTTPGLMRRVRLSLHVELGGRGRVFFLGPLAVGLPACAWWVVGLLG